MAHIERNDEVALIAKPQLASERTKLIAALVLRTLIFAASPKEGNIGFVLATTGRIATHCGLTVKQVRLALSRLETGAYIEKARCCGGLGIAVNNFAALRHRFGVVDDPAIVGVTPEGMVPVLRRTNVEKPQKGGCHEFMGSLPN